MGQAEAVLTLVAEQWPTFVLAMVVLALCGAWWAVRELQAIRANEADPVTELAGDALLATVTRLPSNHGLAPLLPGRIRRLRDAIVAEDERMIAIREQRLRDLGVEPPRSVAECDALLNNEDTP